MVILYKEEFEEFYGYNGLESVKFHGFMHEDLKRTTGHRIILTIITSCKLLQSTHL